MNLKLGIILFVLFFFMVTNITVNSNLGHIANEGMNNRNNYKVVPGPSIISSAPENESTIVFIGQKLIKIFFINRSEGGNKMMSISSPDGFNWSFPETEFLLPGIAYYANQVVMDKSGDLHCVFHIRGEGSNGYGGKTYDLWYCKKPVNGDWDMPRKIFEGYVGAIRSFIQLESGRLLMAFGKAIPGTTEKPKKDMLDFGWNEVICLYSDDSGSNWVESNALRIVIDSEKKTRYGAIEPDVVQLQTGILWMLIRTNKGTLYQSFSHDYGASWEYPTETRFISSDSPADLLRLRDGRIILFFNMNQRWDDPQSYAFGGREVLHAAVSRDDGKTWSGFREVLCANEEQDENIRGDRGTSYTSSVETETGGILFVSGQGRAKTISIFDPDWLDQNVICEKTVLCPHEWTLFGVNKITKEHMKPQNRIKFTYYPDYYESLQSNNIVKNYPISRKGEISFNIELLEKDSRMLFALNDHFSISADSVAAKFSIFNFFINEIYQNGAKIPIKIVWDIDEKSATLYAFNQMIVNKEIQRMPLFGINYLRIAYQSRKYTKNQGFIIDSFSYKKIK